MSLPPSTEANAEADKSAHNKESNAEAGTVDAADPSNQSQVLDSSEQVAERESYETH